MLITKIPAKQPALRIATYFLVIVLVRDLHYPAALAQNSGADNPLYVDPTEFDFSENQQLLERIKSGPHGYFRFINRPFSAEICRRFANDFVSLPPLNLHGDAHVEQYAVTDLGRGLTDFDDSSAGPGILDLMRFSVSLRLACLENGWQEKAAAVIDTFLAAYRMALAVPDFEAPEPRIAGVIRAGFSYDKPAYFRWAESNMEPISPELQDSLFSAMQPYIEMMLAENPDFAAGYFQIVRAGRLRMGIGSALDVKYLVRIHGQTDDPLDDYMLEIKEVRDISGIPCITRAEASDPFRILLGQARIAYQPFRHLGFFRLQGLTFWVHSWVQNYREVSIKKSFPSISDLAEVAFDVGVQLGHGHTRQVAAPFDAQLRREQLEAITVRYPAIRTSSRVYAEQVVEAWQAFCARLETK